MDMKFDHIGVVVPALAQGRDHLSRLLSIQDWTAEFEDPVNGVLVQFGRDSSGVCYELVAPFGEGSPVARALKAGDFILNHVAYLVLDLVEAAKHMRANRCLPLGKPNPAVAYGGHRIQFFMSPLRFIAELIEAPDHHHLYMRKS